MQAITAIVATLALPYMLDPNNANMQGKVGFVFGGTSLLSAVWAFLRLPETAGRTYDEINYMFEKKVPARNFRNYKIPQMIGSTHESESVGEKKEDIKNPHFVDFEV